jgi:hypothetical protein
VADCQPQMLSEQAEAFLNLSLGTKFTMIGETRKTSFLKQFCLLFKRSFLYSARNPKSLAALVVMGIMNSIIFSSIFY